jgi:hypothetical protein
VAAIWTRVHAAVTDGVTVLDGGATVGTWYDRPLHIHSVASREQARALVRRQRLVTAAVWQTAASSPTLSMLYTKMAQDDPPMLLPDAVTSVFHVSRSALYGWSSAGATDASQRDSGRAQSVYGACIRQVLDLRQEFGISPSHDTFTLEMALLLAEWCLYRGDLYPADALITTVRHALHPRLAQYHVWGRDVELLQDWLSLRRGGMQDSCAALPQSRTTMTEQDAAWLLRRIQFQLEASHGASLVLLLAPLEQCLQWTRELRLDGLHAVALALQAQVELRRREPDKAQAMIQAILPTLLQTQHVSVAAEAYLTLAKCYVQQAKRGTAVAAQALFSLALQELAHGAELFQKCHDSYHLREVYYLQARVYDLVPNHGRHRDAAAGRFRQVSCYLLKNAGSPQLHEDLVSSLVDSAALLRLASRPTPGETSAAA